MWSNWLPPYDWTDKNTQLYEKIQGLRCKITIYGHGNKECIALMEPKSLNIQEKKEFSTNSVYIGHDLSIGCCFSFRWDSGLWDLNP